MRGLVKAPIELIDFEYRKLFGLSYRQFMEEPVDVFELNKTIIFLQHKIARYEAKRRERAARRKGR